MRIESFDTDQRVFLVAEIGNNHEGSFALAQDMIGRAAEAGADAVKFQTIVPELLVRSADTQRLATLNKFRFSYPQFEALAQQARGTGVIFFSTPFDLESARFLDGIQSVFKIASGDNSFFPLIDAVAKLRKPMILSTGLADLALLDNVHERIHAAWAAAGVNPGLALLHCVTSYPVPQSQANLGAIATLRARFPNITIGYSDHTLGIDAAVYAVAGGARIIEKHFTLDKNYSDFRDHQLSADPADFRRMTDAIRHVSEMLGSGHKAPQECEAPLQQAARRSIAAAADLPAGTRLASEHLIWVRPGTGLAPGSESQLLGKLTTRALARGEIIENKDVKALA